MLPQKNSEKIPVATDAKFMSLYDYLSLAKRCIKKYAGNDIRARMLADDDAISFVAERLMYGTCHYRKNKGTLLSTYYGQCSIWAITRWKIMVVKQCKNHLSINYAVGENPLADVIEDKRSKYNENMGMDMRGLTPLQLDCITKHFQHNITYANIAKQRGVTRQAVHDVVRRSLLKLAKGI